MMKKQIASNKLAIDLDDIDFEKLCRVANKVQLFIFRKISNPIESYLLLKILCYSIEDNFGFRLDSEDEQKFRKMFS